MRICGVTFDHTTNYGSCFQAYALQTVIEQMQIGGEACHYDLLPLALLPTAQIQAPEKHVNPMLRLKRRILGRMDRYRRRQFAKFEDSVMHYANCHSAEALADLNGEYDAFVCGSDVIWNLSYTNSNPAYFLDFAEKYKFSYAASFGKADIHYEFDGVQLPENPEDFYARCISGLDAVSVREEDAVRIASQFTDRDVQCVCDPVLLLDADAWNRTLGKAGTPGKPYIFAYNTHRKPVFEAFLEKICAQTGLRVVHVTWNSMDAVKQRALRMPDPLSWLRLLRDAEWVVTNSFHAMAFAVIFHKKFFAVMQDGKEARTNVRIYDFLEQVGLTDRIVTSVPGDIGLSEPDFREADAAIREKRASSLAFLRNSLEAAWQRKTQAGAGTEETAFKRRDGRE